MSVKTFLISLFLVGFGIWLIIYEATQGLELEVSGVALGAILVSLFGVIAIDGFIQIRKYGISGALRRRDIDPTWEVPLSPVAPRITFQIKSVNPLSGGQVIGICRVCNLPLYESEETEACPNCAALMHKTHFLEWLKIKGYCPNCKTHVPFVQHPYSGY